MIHQERNKRAGSSGKEKRKPVTLKGRGRWRSPSEGGNFHHALVNAEEKTGGKGGRQGRGKKKTGFPRRFLGGKKKKRKNRGHPYMKKRKKKTAVKDAEKRLQ